jgi:hypothetical protein
VKLLAGLFLAFASTVTLNWGFFVQHRASNTLQVLSLRHPWTALRLLFTNGRWVLGYVAGLGGWGLYIVALFFAPISLVQAVSAGGIGLLALFVWRVAHVRFSRRERAAIEASASRSPLGCRHPELSGSTQWPSGLASCCWAQAWHGDLVLVS